METFKAISHLKEGVKVESISRNFKLILDEPKDLGGNDEAMNPVEALLCALGSCQCIMARMIASKMRVNLEDFYVELEGDLDLRGLSGVQGIRPGYQEIRVTFHVKSSDSEIKINKLINTIEKSCPVGDCIENGVKINTRYVID
ncbi:OsmC family protein [Romboutsia sp. 1001216sp1]|uniref:OsmC family protein n=1 Tax=unclassified Romboutsia TaxID=2626894 RepID=UPI00189E0274|nr:MULTISPECIES: OsmC family protein [unclassified Romboutsia]MDB8803407.1 OsmC family protein [Romboutsia sp. 1001216sp1]MDB8814804.1 OsmC family protein [Romboutsia sp. 1001216sp1]